MRGAYDGPNDGTIDGFVLGDADGTIEADADGDGAGVINGVTVGKGEICIATALEPVASPIGIGPNRMMAAQIIVAPATARRIDWRLMIAFYPLSHDLKAALSNS